MDKKTFYITTTLPYVNADPHIGFALELVQADVIARYHQARGEEVVFNMGTDEHGIKIYRKALEAGQDPQAYVDEYAAKFEKLLKTLNISTTDFIRTTEPRHQAAAREFWDRCAKNGDIYRAAYKTKYCIGCELEKTDSELENGRCVLHPNLPIEEIEEENYFFKFSKFQKPLLKFYEANPHFVLPEFRFNEIKSFVESGLRDFSISRLKEKMPWGVPVPGDEKQVMYVWFDALVNYISTLGWPENEKHFEDFWGTAAAPNAVQIAGKDNLRQQSAIWQAMLMSAGLPNSKQILIHGFVGVDGQKMSKSLGNVVDPFHIVQKYGLDAVRYFLLREIPSGEDGDFSEKKLVERYNGDLANGLGNLVQRVATLIDGNMDGELIYDASIIDKELIGIVEEIQKKYDGQIASFKLHEALASVWELIGTANAYINEKKPWSLAKENASEFLTVMTNAVFLLYRIANMLEPFMPDTVNRVRKTFGAEPVISQIDGYKFLIKKGEGLFPRL